MECIGENCFYVIIKLRSYRILSGILGKYLHTKKNDSDQITKVDKLFNPVIDVISVDEVK